MTLEGDVMKYDRASTNILTRELLLNIARARHRDPIHFIGIANIAATYNFQMNAGIPGMPRGFNYSTRFSRWP